MDAISLLMFGLPALAAFGFSVIALFELKATIQKGESPVLVIVFGLLAVPFWFVEWLFWVASATMEMFVPFGWFWFALGLVFIFVVIAGLAYQAKQSVTPENKPQIVESSA